MSDTDQTEKIGLVDRHRWLLLLCAGFFMIDGDAEKSAPADGSISYTGHFASL